jgi:putative DNA primase/helicase
LTDDSDEEQSQPLVPSSKAKPTLLRLDTDEFPDPPTGNGGPPATMENTKHLLTKHRITARYNVIKKRPEILIPNHAGSTENAPNTSVTKIQSLAARHGMPIGPIPAQLDAIADENPYNPVAEWIHSQPWDGEDRVPAFCATVTTEEEFSEELKITLMHKWALSAAAAALLPSGFHARGVLVFQGKQGLGKSSWCRNLVPDSALREEVIKLDHHLDGSNKDSQIGAITHWIVEIGELDGSFRKDIARLKGFLTNDRDKIRRPYDRSEAEYQRRTVFTATVNQRDFLVDPTGNSRWWTLPCVAIDYRHTIDMQQLFAQLAEEINGGAIWWLTAAEEEELEANNSKHRSYSLVVDRLEAVLDHSPSSSAKPVAMTASELLEVAGLDRPTNPQAKECAAYLRERFGKSKRIQGREKWYVRLLKSGAPTFTDDEHEEEEYDPTAVLDDEPQPAAKRPKPDFG